MLRISAATESVEAGVSGRYVRIHLDAQRALSLAEVQIYPPADR